MSTRMSRRAEMDLAEITNFIALDNPARAFQFEEELLEHARRIGVHPSRTRSERICAPD